MIRDILRKKIEKALNELGLEKADFSIEHPLLKEHGDYSTNVALILGKKNKKNLKELAKEIVDKIDKTDGVEKIEIAPNGFINFFLSKSFFAESLREAQAEGFGKNESLKGKKILIEHSSPNLFKPFHVGHVTNNTIGESLVRLANYTAAEVIPVSYPSDFSIGIAKSVWAILDKGLDKLKGLKTAEEKLNFLGECYSDGVKVYESSNEIQEKVEEIAKKIEFKQKGPELEAYNLGKKINLEYFKYITERLGSDFTGNYIFESEAGEVGKKIVLENIGKVFEESDRAIIYKGGDEGLHTRVFINGQGRPVYEAKDLGLIKIKFDKFSPDESIVVTDREQGSYFEVVLNAAGKINKEWQNKTIHITHGRMRFNGERMSSRLGGDIPSAEKILKTLRLEVVHYSEFGEMTRSINYDDIEKISIAALKFAILKNSPGKNINFDEKKSLSFEGDTGPYVQYSYVRAKSVLEIANTKGLEPSETAPENWEVTDIERLVYRFPEIVERAWDEKSPQYIATFLIELSSAFNSFYAKEKIAEVGGEYKLFLTKAVANVLERGLYLLGIGAPEKM